MERYGVSLVFLILKSILESRQGILNEVWKHKLIFVETPDANETSIALENYRRVGLVQLCFIESSMIP